jgi:hypothetical protein
VLSAVLAGCLVTVLAFVLLTDGTQRADLEGREDDPRPDRAAATADLVFDLLQALRDRTSGGAAELAALTDPATPSAATELADLHDNVQELRVDRLELRYLAPADLALTAEQRERYGPDAWVSEVQLTWRFRGFDRAVSTLEVPIVADWSGDRAVFETAGVTSGYRVPLWFTEPLAVRRTPAALVLAADAQRARALAAQARTAVTTVRRTLPRWDEPLVVEAPASAADFRTAAGTTRASSGALAAVTTTTDGSALEDAAVHVYLNPSVFEPLGPVGRQIVMSHEATHVALGAATTTMPLWLSEGMADHVALVGSTLPDTVLAAQIRTLVRRTGPPEALPGRAEFDGSNRDIGAWYEAAWLAVRLLAETYGRPALLDFYTRTEVDGDTRRAFSDVLGTSEAAFVRAWRSELAALAE